MDVKHINAEGLELALQSDSELWPCMCRMPRATGSDLMCPECWEKIPAAKREGYAKLERDTEEHLLAAEQILRIAKRNLDATRPKKDEHAATMEKLEARMIHYSSMSSMSKGGPKIYTKAQMERAKAQVMMEARMIVWMFREDAASESPGNDATLAAANWQPE